MLLWPTCSIRGSDCGMMRARARVCVFVCLCVFVVCACVLCVFVVRVFVVRVFVVRCARVCCALCACACVFLINLFNSMPHYTVILHALHNLSFS